MELLQVERVVFGQSGLITLHFENYTLEVSCHQAFALEGGLTELSTNLRNGDHIWVDLPLFRASGRIREIPVVQAS